jgi:hypothetical protein
MLAVAPADVPETGEEQFAVTLSTVADEQLSDCPKTGEHNSMLAETASCLNSFMRVSFSFLR